jgi:hypothetical protein
MREDLWDMNPGKGMAQAAHAQAEFDEFVEYRCGPEYRQDDLLWSSVCQWKEDRSFGTTLVVSATWEDMCDIADVLPYAGVVTDPTYPWRNYYGKLFTSCETTCMWAFVTDEDSAEMMKKYPLHS